MSHEHHELFLCEHNKPIIHMNNTHMSESWHTCVYESRTPTTHFYVNTNNSFIFMCAIHMWVSHGTFVCMSHKHRQLISMWTPRTHSYSYLFLVACNTAQMWMSHGTRVNESWNMWMSHGTRVNKSWHTSEWVMAHMWLSHGTHVTKSWHTCDWVMVHMWMRHGTQVTESWYTCEWVMAHRWMRHCTHVNESFHTEGSKTYTFLQ